MTTLSWSNGSLQRNGEPHRILAGAIHYFRVHPDLWADRLQRIASLGVNTIDTYVAWNFHERREHEVSFSGWRDLERFITIAGDTGLDVLVRPGPYICAEWSNGGLPVWLTSRLRSQRTSEPEYLAAIEGWFDALIPRLAPLQAVHGGPIVGVQVENEYGSYGSDRAYLEHVRDALTERGIVEMLFTADGTTSDMLRHGRVSGALPTLTLGSDAATARRVLDELDPSLPLVVAEYWNGWFDHWGTPHHTRSPESVRAVLDEILDLDGSVTLYMAHGGTNFGLWAGANFDGVIQSTTTSYDYDAPIAEDGGQGTSFATVRDAFAKVRGSEPPPFPGPPVMQPAQSVPLMSLADAWHAFRALPVVCERSSPATFDELGLDEGLVLYAAHAAASPGSVVSIDGLHDRAIVMADGVRVGSLERGGTLSLELPHGAAMIEVLVETRGRINYGHLLGEHKGLTGVRIGRRLVHGWSHRVIDLDEFAAMPSPSGGDASVTLAHIEVAEPADTWLAVDGAVSAFVWVGETLIGRLRDVGPQRTVFVPGPLWRTGVNTVQVLDLDGEPTRVRLEQHPDFCEPDEFVGS